MSPFLSKSLALLLMGLSLVGVSAGTSVAADKRGIDAPVSSGVKSLAIGEGFACAVTTIGHVLCWGQGSVGQLGIDGIQTFNMPVMIKSSASGGPLSDAIQVVAGRVSACALLSDTSVSCWGNNASGAMRVSCDCLK